MAITSIKTGSSFTNLQKYNDFLGPNAPFIPTDFESIATATGSGTSVTFSSIPSTYKHLQLRCLSRTTSGVAGVERITIRFNGDSATNYTLHDLFGNGSTATAEGYANTTYIYAQEAVAGGGTTANVMGAAIIDIHEYANTAMNKTVRIFNGMDGNTASTSYKVGLGSGVWRSTSAINSIALSFDGATMASTSVFSLYGIKG
jgi:hypothetical protein